MKDRNISERFLAFILESKIFAFIYRAKHKLGDSRLLRNGWMQRYEDYLSKPMRLCGLTIEVSNICNALCTFCGYQYQQRKQKILSTEDFKKIIDEMLKFGDNLEVALTPTVGEVLMDKNLAEKIRYASQFPSIKKISFFTNAILLKPEKYEELVDAGLTEVQISISGLEVEEYERVYRKKKFDVIMQNLREIAKSPSFLKVKPIINLRTDRLFPEKTLGYQELEELGYDFTRVKLFDNWSGRITSKDLTGSMYIRPNRDKKIPCVNLFSGPYVYTDGRVSACACRDMEGDSELIMGNIFEEGLEVIYKEKRHVRIQERFLSGDIPDICKDCRQYSPKHL